jgi:hypothetical protein
MVACIVPCVSLEPWAWILRYQDFALALLEPIFPSPSLRSPDLELRTCGRLHSSVELTLRNSGWDFLPKFGFGIIQATPRTSWPHLCVMSGY